MSQFQKSTRLGPLEVDYVETRILRNVDNCENLLVDMTQLFRRHYMSIFTAPSVEYFGPFYNTSYCGTLVTVTHLLLWHISYRDTLVTVAR